MRSDVARFKDGADDGECVNRNLWLLAGLQGLSLTNNVTFIAINGLVGLAMAPGYYSANGQLYRFTSAELSAPSAREKAVSLVMSSGLIGARRACW
jgi:hypothetical protein